MSALRSFALRAAASLVAIAWAGPAAASSASGYVIAYNAYNSAQSYACYFIIGSSSSSTSGTTYVVDDTSGEFAATCDAAMLAMYFNDKLDVTYTSSGGYRMVSGIESDESGNIPYFATNSSTGTSSADRCMATMTSSSGDIDAYVDDSNPEEDMTCGMLALMHFYGSASWTVNRTSGEINYLYGKY
jgi:hypothetical protein